MHQTRLGTTDLGWKQKRLEYWINSWNYCINGIMQQSATKWSEVGVPFIVTLHGRARPISFGGIIPSHCTHGAFELCSNTFTFTVRLVTFFSWQIAHSELWHRVSLIWSSFSATPDSALLLFSCDCYLDFYTCYAKSRDGGVFTRGEGSTSVEVNRITPETVSLFDALCSFLQMNDWTWPLHSTTCSVTTGYYARC